MTQNGLLILQSLFQDIWRLFNSWYFPGTHVTPAGLGLFVLFFSLVIRFIRKVFQNNDSGED